MSAIDEEGFQLLLQFGQFSGMVTGQCNKAIHLENDKFHDLNVSSTTELPYWMIFYS
jgi:hypothetical protein